MHFDAAGPNFPVAGKSLTQVSIMADSHSVTVDDGSVFDATDVGRHISIPGADDMVTEIDELAEFRTIEGAAMAAGSDALTFTLVDTEDGFRADPHETWRIAVEGAGAGGGRLVTDVVKVVDPRTELRLATKASVDVNATTAVLNDPTAVRLADHARADVTSLTIDLRGRQFHNAVMNLGSKRLTCANADFTYDDVHNGTSRIVGAAHHVTTITAATAGGVQIKDPAPHGVTNGTAAVWDPNGDSYGGMQALIAAVAAAGLGPHEIDFGRASTTSSGRLRRPSGWMP